MFLRYQAILKSSDFPRLHPVLPLQVVSTRDLKQTAARWFFSRDLLVPFGGHQQPLSLGLVNSPSQQGLPGVYFLKKSTHLFAESVGVLHLFSSDPEINNPVLFFKVYQTYDMSLKKS